MYHSIIFYPSVDYIFSSPSYSKNTWEDWHLIPSSRPVVNPPTPKTTYIDVPGGDGIIDLSTALTGYPIYNNREGSWNFIVANGYENWCDLYGNILEYLQGKKMIAILEDDPNYYYEGRFYLSNWTSNADGTGSTVTIDYNVNPYKMCTVMNGKDDLQPGFVYDISEDIGRMPVYPIFNISSTDGEGMTFYYRITSESSEYKSVHLSDGVNKTYRDVKLYSMGEDFGYKTQVYIEGNGTVDMRWRGGVL